MRHIDHLVGDDPGAGEFELGDGLAGLAAVHRVIGGAFRYQLFPRGTAVVLGLHRARRDPFEAAARDPLAPQWRQTGGQVDRHARVRVGSGGVIDLERGLPRSGVQRAFAERHQDIRPALGRDMDLSRTGDRPRGHAAWPRGGFRLDSHKRLLLGSLGAAIGSGKWRVVEIPVPPPA